MQPGDFIPAFVTLIFMPFSFSLAYGLIAGIITYAAINTATWFLGVISGGRFLPPDYDDKEYWSCKCCPFTPAYTPSCLQRN
jgi:AGZA family xanthine/uracil permease-like MFS transporter